MYISLNARNVSNVITVRRWSDPVSKAQSKSWSHSTTNLAQWCESRWQPFIHRVSACNHHKCERRRMNILHMLLAKSSMFMVCINSSLLWMIYTMFIYFLKILCHHEHLMDTNVNAQNPATVSYGIPFPFHCLNPLNWWSGEFNCIVEISLTFLWKAWDVGGEDFQTQYLCQRLRDGVIPGTRFCTSNP